VVWCVTQTNRTVRNEIQTRTVRGWMDGRKDKERVKRERVCARRRNEVRAKKSKKERVCVASTLCVWCMLFGPLLWEEEGGGVGRSSSWMSSWSDSFLQSTTRDARNSKIMSFGSFRQKAFHQAVLTCPAHGRKRQNLRAHFFGDDSEGTTGAARRPNATAHPHPP